MAGSLSGDHCTTTVLYKITVTVLHIIGKHAWYASTVPSGNLYMYSRYVMC